MCQMVFKFVNAVEVIATNQRREPTERNERREERGRSIQSFPKSTFALLFMEEAEMVLTDSVAKICRQFVRLKQGFTGRPEVVE